jgi:hypothetical protein
MAIVYRGNSTSESRSFSENNTGRRLIAMKSPRTTTEITRGYSDILTSFLI